MARTLRSIGATPANSGSPLRAQVVWRGLPASMVNADRASSVFMSALKVELGREAQKIVQKAKANLPSPRSGYISEESGKSGSFGVGSGAMRESIHKELNEGLLSQGVVLFSIQGDDEVASYWRFQESGWMSRSGNFIEGLHFIERAVRDNTALEFFASKRAWDAARGYLNSSTNRGGGIIDVLSGSVSTAVGTIATEQGDLEL